jgi:radical SAM protein with 4Fe4S-binding SPASM domain
MRLREDNRWLNEVEFIHRRVVLASYPPLVFVELTQNCNLSCRMCRGAAGSNPALNMSTELFGYLSAELFPYATWVDLRGWGESTMLPTFPAIVRSAIETGARLRLITNALAMTDELWELFCSGDNSIGVSLDSINPGTASTLGRGDVNKVIQRLARGLEIRRRGGRCEIYVNTVVSSFTLTELPEMVSRAQELGISRIVVNPVSCSRHSELHLCHVREQLAPVLERATALAKSVGVTLQLGAALDPSLVVEEGLAPICPNPWSNVLIDYRGRVGFCHHLVGNEDMLVGSLTRSSFHTIWNSEQYQELRRQHVGALETRTLPSFGKCTWCYSNRYLDIEHLSMPSLSSREVSTRGTLPLLPAQRPPARYCSSDTSAPFNIV